MSPIITIRDLHKTFGKDIQPSAASTSTSTVAKLS